MGASTIEIDATACADSSSLRHRLLQLVSNLDDARARRRLYALVAIFLFALSLVLGVVKWRYSEKEPKLDFAGSDGKFYYMYIASVIVDGDLDLTNQFREEWPMEAYTRTETGYVLDKHPIGVSLSLLPSFLPAHAVSWLIHSMTGGRFFLPNGYTAIYQIFNMAWIFFLCFATFALLDRLMTRHMGDDGGGVGGLRGEYIAAGVLWAWLGTQYLYHAARFPMMANVISTFWVTACIACCADAVQAIRVRRTVGWHWPAMVFCAAMAVVCRPTNVMVAAFGLYALYQLTRQGLLFRLARLTPALALALIPLLLQLLVWRVMFGHYITYSYGGNTYSTGGEEKFYWTDPVLWKSLFSLRAGLFVWVPIWALGTAGALVYSFRRVPGVWILGCYIVAFAILWYMDSAWWCWPFGSYPGRAYLEMIGLPALGIALLFQHTESKLVQRRALVAFLILAVVYTGALEAGFDLKLVPRYGDEVIRNGPIAALKSR